MAKRSSSSADKSRKDYVDHSVVARSPDRATAGRQGESASVTELKAELAGIDRQMVRLLDDRAAAVRAWVEARRAEGEEATLGEVDRGAVEEAIKGSTGAMPAEGIAAALREASSACRALAMPMRVAFLGPAYTYSHLAAIHRFGQSMELVPVVTIAAVFEAVRRGQADFGMAPIENSTDGRVVDTLDAFAKSPLKICGEVPLRIHHCLLGSGKLEDVKEIYSKPQALSQCRHWIAHHLPQAKTVEIASTAEAARLALASKSAAAIASRQAGTHYELNVLVEKIEDNPHNLTRFVVIGKESGERSGRDRTALMFEVSHQPGALADAMTILKRNRLNLTFIESFPIPNLPGRYLFFVELDGHEKELRVRKAVASLGKKALRLEVLGSYARTEPID